MNENNKYSDKYITTKKVRIFPTRNQIEYFNKAFGIHRKVWNMCVNSFVIKGNKFNKYDVQNRLTTLAKNNKKYAYFNEVNSMVRQECLSMFKMSLDKYNNIQKKSSDKSKGRPRKKDDNQVFRYNNKGNPVKPKGKKHFYLTTIKNTPRLLIKTNESLLFLKSKDIRFIDIAIRKDKLNHYYACISYEELNHKEYNSHKYKRVGIDMGIKNPITYSLIKEGKYEDKVLDFPTERLKVLHRRLSYIDKRLSKKKEGSKNYYKLLLKKNKLSRKISNIRREFRFQTINFLCKNFKTIIYEDFPADYTNNGFKYDHNRLKDISRYAFLEHLWFKAKFYDNILIPIPRGTPTTQTCSKCGNVLSGTNKLGLNNRTYNCSICGLSLDRDINSSRNIRNYDNEAKLIRIPKTRRLKKSK
jgi:putative transposase